MLNSSQESRNHREINQSIGVLIFSGTFVGVLVVDIYFCGHGQETSKEMGTQYPRKNTPIAVLGYAMRFLKYNSSLGPSLQVLAPTTPDRISDMGIVEISREDHRTEV